MALRQGNTPLSKTHKAEPVPKKHLTPEIDAFPENEFSNLLSPCPICLEDFPENKLNHVFETCNHYFCTPCLQGYLKEQINNFKVAKISCPQEGCQSILTTRHIKELLDDKDFKTYEAQVLKKVTLSNPKHRLCPKPGCTRMIPYSTKSLKTKCKCGAVICNSCGKLTHEGKTCLESIDMEFQLYTTEHEVKFCTVCKTTIKRTEGCKHMTCPICDYEWCWECGRQYSSNHEPNCPKTWDPYPPTRPISSWKDCWASFSIVTKIILIIIMIPFLPVILVASLFLWPDYVYSYNDDDKFYLIPLKEKWEESSLTTKVSLIILLILLSPFFLLMFLLSWNFYCYFHDEAMLERLPWKIKLAQSSLLKAALMVVALTLMYPLVLTGLYLFWPLYEFSWGSKLSTKRPFKSSVLVIVSFLIGAVSLPLTLGNILLLPPIVTGLIFLRYVYRRIKAFLRREHLPQNNTNQQANNKRWMASDPNTFSYISHGRPVLPMLDERIELPRLPPMPRVPLILNDLDPPRVRFNSNVQIIRIEEDSPPNQSMHIDWENERRIEPPPRLSRIILEEP